MSAESQSDSKKMLPLEKKKKILRIICRLNIGGPAVHTILLTAGLNKDKFISILVSGMTDKDEGDMMYLAKSKNVNPIVIPELGRRVNFRNDLITFYKTFQLIKKERPDIIHTHTAKAGALGRLAGIFYNLISANSLLVKSKQRCRLVHTFHGHVLEGYFGRIKTTLFIWIERILAKFTDKIIVVSERIKEDLLNLGIGCLEKIIVIPLGLELEKFLQLGPIEHTNSEIKIGIVGRLVPIKNHRMFLKIAKNIKEHFVFLKNGREKSKIKFSIIGDGELKEVLEDYTKELGIQNEVTFLGWQKDLEGIYQDLDIVALTSLNEGTPVSLIEAMASAKAVIATDVGGVRELIGDNERGILIKSDSIDDFVQGLRRLLEDADFRNRLGQQARDFVRDKFTKERLINDIEKLYNNILKKELDLCAC